MFTTGAKYFFGVTLFGLVAALVYGFGSGGGLLGVLTLGLRGGAGELFGMVVLASVAASALFLGLVIIAFRDADAEALAAYAHTDVVPRSRRPRRRLLARDRRVRRRDHARRPRGRRRPRHPRGRDPASSRSWSGW